MFRISTTTLVFLGIVCLFASYAWAQTASPGPAPAVTPNNEHQKVLPRYRQLVKGALLREIYSVSDQQHRIDVRIIGILVGPGQSSGEIRFEDDLILQVRSGRGVITVGDRQDELNIGVTRSIAAEQPFRIKNFNEASPINMRGILIAISQ